MSKNAMRKAVQNAMYLKLKGWIWAVEEGRKGWIDPKTHVHYYQKEALQIQLIRDARKNKRFRSEPMPYC